jgi:hypothetical protein
VNKIIEDSCQFLIQEIAMPAGTRSCIQQIISISIIPGDFNHVFQSNTSKEGNKLARPAGFEPAAF